MTDPVLAKGKLSFSIESRVLRELGERLVKQPEVALLELVKNAYDADATHCRVEYNWPDRIVVADNGSGMTLDRFRNAWMRIGTSSKEATRSSTAYGRRITGEKGIGRFAVRYLGGQLELETVAYDPGRQGRTRLVVEFDWVRFDQNEDLGGVEVDYLLTSVGPDEAIGTTLTISKLRPRAESIDWKQVRTGSASVVTAMPVPGPEARWREVEPAAVDPGFRLRVVTGEDEGTDLTSAILSYFVLRAELTLVGDRLHVRVFRDGGDDCYLLVEDEYPNCLGPVQADIRFFPRRTGTFAGAPIDGRVAYKWLKENGGVRVFDNGFMVQPYGMKGDDWLRLNADTSRNERNPRSSITRERFRMPQDVWAKPAENWMLRLPENAQLIGSVQVQGGHGGGDKETGLIAAADREGFIDNKAFGQLTDVIRGAVETLAFADRQIKREQDEADARRRLDESRGKTRTAIEEIEADATLQRSQKNRIVAMLVESQQQLEMHEAGTKERERQLEIMSLLGIVGGFMTHEFGVAIKVLHRAQADLDEIGKTDPAFAERARDFAKHADALKAFVDYSRAYVEGARARPKEPYAARPRLNQVKRVFGQYAADRRIEVDIEVEGDVMVPLIPAALYNGVAQNLFTNALKAVTAKVDAVGDDRRIVFRAWNDARFHRLQVSDTGTGIPEAVRAYVFDPLFTTTESRADPLGSGMGLGLALVRRGAAAFGGAAELVPPPPGFSTCVEVRFPIEAKQ